MGSGNEIPTKSRQLLRQRDEGQCVRCGSGQGSQWHHRRRRGIKGGHFQHCACNGVTLCPTCHTWVHANPALARERGFIVSAHIDEPNAVPVDAFYGKVLLDCDGTTRYTT